MTHRIGFEAGELVHTLAIGLGLIHIKSTVLLAEICESIGRKPHGIAVAAIERGNFAELAVGIKINIGRAGRGFVFSPLIFIAARLLEKDFAVAHRGSPH